MAWSYKLTIGFLIATNLVSASGLAATEANYSPTYWVWRVDSNEAIVRAKQLGFGGVGVKAAANSVMKCSKDIIRGQLMVPIRCGE